MEIDYLSQKQLMWIISTLRRECCDLAHWGKCDEEVVEYRQKVIIPLMKAYNRRYKTDHALSEIET